MEFFQEIYSDFINLFPVFLRPFVSVIAGIGLIVAVIQILRRQFVWLVALVVLLPASVSVLKQVSAWVAMAVRFLFGMR